MTFTNVIFSLKNKSKYAAFHFSKWHPFGSKPSFRQLTALGSAQLAARRHQHPTK